MLEQDFLLKAVKCTTIDQITNLIGNFLEQDTFIVNDKNILISSNIENTPPIPNNWLENKSEKQSFFYQQKEYIRNTINTFSLNTWYLFVGQSKAYPLIGDQLKLSLKIINNFNERYSANPDQSELNTLFSKLIQNNSNFDINAFTNLFPDKIVCLTSMANNHSGNQQEFIKQMQELVSPMPVAEDCDQNLVTIIEENTLDKIATKLKRIGKEFKHYYFISEPYPNIAKTPDFLEICKQSAKIANKMGTIEIVNSTQKYNIYVILNRIQNIDLLKNTMCTQLLFLKNYDHQNNTDLFETLYEYIESDCKLNVTAEKLHLHRNSLSKRLKKVDDLLTINYEDPNKTFGLRLSYRIFNFLNI